MMGEDFEALIRGVVGTPLIFATDVGLAKRQIQPWGGSGVAGTGIVLFASVPIHGRNVTAGEVCEHVTITAVRRR